jgi:hypothetical protein
LPTFTGWSRWCRSLLITKSTPCRKLGLKPRCTSRVGVTGPVTSGSIARSVSGIRARDGAAGPTRSVAKRSSFALATVMRL